MRHRNLTQHYNKSPARKGQVWFPGTTAIKKGMGLCFEPNLIGTNTGTDTATDKWGRRGNSVVVPSTTFNRYFAGVASQSYAASSTGQLIDIYEPGSICEIAVGLATAIGVSPAMGTFLTCSASSADAGRFTLAGMPGRGSAIALETLARADGGDIALASWTGAASTAWTTVTTITATGIGTACGYDDDDIDATDFVVVILGGSTTADGTVPVTTGEYAVATAPTADTITVAANVASAASNVCLYVIKNTYPTIMAYLDEGPESGLQEVISPDSDTAVASMTGGTTFIAGGFTLAANTTYTLADYVTEGLRKVFAGLGELTTSDYAITVTSGVEADNTALATIAIDAAGEHITLEWQGGYGGATTGHHRELSSAGATKG